jgi:hypothetical protein
LAHQLKRLLGLVAKNLEDVLDENSFGHDWAPGES